MCLSRKVVAFCNKRIFNYRTPSSYSSLAPSLLLHLLVYLLIHTTLKANICILLPNNKLPESKAVFQQAIKTMNMDDWNMLDENDNPPSRKKQRENPCLKEGSKLCPISQQVVFLVPGVILLS